MEPTPQTQSPAKRGGLGLAFRCFLRVFKDAVFATKAREWLNQAVAPALPPAPTAPPKPSAEPLRLLALLQREGRLIDFLMEDIAHLPDAQIGAATKDIHAGCRKLLLEHLTIKEVVDAKEDEAMTVAAGFDPSAICLLGNLSGQPPYRGTVRHRGWKVQEIKLAALPAGQDPFILAPAEVELA